MRELDFEISSLRVRVVVFRDYKYDGDQSMVESPFLNFRLIMTVSKNFSRTFRRAARGMVLKTDLKYCTMP